MNITQRMLKNDFARIKICESLAEKVEIKNGAAGLTAGPVRENTRSDFTSEGSRHYTGPS
jgi:hypothetical protein